MLAFFLSFLYKYNIQVLFVKEIYKMAVITNFGVPTSGETGATLMPKLQYRFRVTFDGLGNSKATKATRNVVSVTRPSLTHEEVTVDAYNSKIFLAGKHTWETITLVLRDDVDSEVIELLGRQLNRQVDHNDQTSSFAGQNYKFSMKIQTLDGSNDGGSDDAVLDQWSLVGCFITNIQYGDLNYGTSDVVQVTATIRFDNASHEVDGANGDDVLSSLNTTTSKNANGKSAT